MSVKRCVVLGASGLVGRHLMARLGQDRPDLELLGFSRQGLDLEAPDAVMRLQGVVDAQTAVIFCSGLTRQHGDTLQTLERNLKMVLSVCRALEHAPPGQLLYLSSSAVYGEDIHLVGIDEETPVNPRTYYGISKYSAERMLWKSLGEKTSLTLLRPPALYGPGDVSRAYGPSQFFDAAQNRRPLTLWGDGQELREFVLINDLVDILLGLLQQPLEGVLNPVSGHSVTFLEMIGWIERRLGRALERQERPRSKEKVDHVFTGARLKSHFPDFRFHSLEEGLELSWQALNSPASTAQEMR